MGEIMQEVLSGRRRTVWITLFFPEDVPIVLGFGVNAETRDMNSQKHNYLQQILNPIVTKTITRLSKDHERFWYNQKYKKLTNLIVNIWMAKRKRMFSVM